MRIVRKTEMQYLSRNIIPITYFTSLNNNIDLPLDYTSTNTHTRMTAAEVIPVNRRLTGFLIKTPVDNKPTTSTQLLNNNKNKNGYGATRRRRDRAWWQQQCDWATVSKKKNTNKSSAASTSPTTRIVRASTAE